MSPLPVPLTVVGGYLGAGKTTAITDMLTSPGAERIGVIVNDFGELDVDARLLGAADGIVGFSNGCVCCVASDGLAPALAGMRSLPLDRVVIEASGIADPAALATWAGSPGYAPGGVVVCADASTLSARLRDRWVGDTVARQLAAADVVLLTHADATSDALVEGAAFLARQHARGARVLVRGPLTGLTEALDAVGSPRSSRPGSTGHAAHETWTVVVPDGVAAAALARALERLPPGVVRVKGFVRDAAGRASLVQATPGRAAVTPAPGVPAPARGALTVIAEPGTSRVLPDLLALGVEPAADPSDPSPRKEPRHAHSH